MAERNQDLERGKGLIAAVAELVGGPRCTPVPGVSLSHAQLNHLLYHNHTKYTRGAVVAEAIVDPTNINVAQTLRKNKQHASTLMVFEI